MAKRIDSPMTETETVIGTGVKVKGTLVSDGDVSIDGELKGSIKTGGNLTIGVNGVIEANVSARNVKVGGHLVGNIKCESETVIESSGKVKGNVHTGLLAINHGAVFSGQTVMTDGPQSSPEPDEPA